MNKKWIGFILLLLFLIGSILETVIYFKSSQVPQAQPLVVAQNESLIAPAIIDAVSDITKIPSLQSGVIKHIDVVVGQSVKKGQVLFSLDNVLLENNLHINQLTLLQTKQDIHVKHNQLVYLRKQLSRLKSLDRRSISRVEVQEKKHEINMAIAQLKQAKYNLALLKANLKNAELTLSQYTIIAPKDGIVLQINAHPNEFVSSGQQIIFLADAKKVIVRVSLDERDAHRFNPAAPAYLINYNNSALNVPLTFIQLDQYIVTQERLHSRVQEVLYYFNRDDYPNYVAGQLFDANIAIRSNT